MDVIRILPEHNSQPYTDDLESIDPADEVVNLVRNYGYPIEIFDTVETEDKYLISLYRIPNGISERRCKNSKRPVVLIMHGFLASSLDYLLMGPKRGLAYILADCGYDVWLGNYRGSKYACRHTVLDPNLDKQYWNFSFHEIGVYDLSAMIDFITRTTGCGELSYIGTSQGTTSMFVLLSEKPHYNSILKVVICLAPVRLISNARSPIMRNMALYPVTWKPFALMMGWFSFPTKNMIKCFNYFANNYSDNASIVRTVMTRILFTVFGYSDGRITPEEYRLITNNIFNSASVKHFIHFSQNAIQGKFQQFDLGELDNLKLYKQETAPAYDTSNITCPVALFYSEGDWISTPKDVEELKQCLPNVVVDHLVDSSKFNHLDFSFSVNAVELVYDYVQKILDEYNFKN